MWGLGVLGFRVYAVLCHLQGQFEEMNKWGS